jgi:hypothetical protein
MKGANALLCLPAAAGTIKQYSTVTTLLIGDIQPPADTTLCYFSKAAAVGTTASSTTGVTGGAITNAVNAIKVSTTALSCYS